MKIQKSIRYLAAFILLIAIVSLFFTFQNAERDSRSFELVNHTHQVIEETDKINTAVLDMESAVRGYSISGNPTFITNIEHERELLQQGVNGLANLTRDNSVQQKNISALKDLTFRKIGFQYQILSSYVQSKESALALISSLRGKVLSDSIKTITAAMEAEEKRLLGIRVATNRKVAVTRLIYSVFVAIGSLILLVLALLKINKEAILRKSAEMIARESETKYKGLIENSAVVIFSSDLNGVFTYVSNKCFELTGYTPEELVGKPFSALVKDDWKDEVRTFYQKQLQEEVFETQLRFPISTKEGFEKWVEQNIVLLKEEGRPIGFQSIVKDITETKLGEDLLQAAEAQLKLQQEENQFRLQAILDNMPMIVYIKDLQGRFELINKKLKETFNVTDEVALGRFAHDISRTPDAALKFAAADQEVIRTLKPLEMEVATMTVDGERNMLVTKFPLFDQNNKLFAICGIDKDITDMVRSREQLIAAKLRAEHAEKLQEEFLANMSHEIRTPMNGIIGMTNLLSDTSLTEEQKEFVQLIRHSSDTLHALINDILDLSKIKAGRMTVEEVDFNLHAIIEGAVAPLQPKAKEKGVLLKKQIAEEVPVFVKGDQHKLTQVLNNLLSNAVKFTHTGSIHLAVKMLPSFPDSVTLEFMVSDTGIGIANEHLDSIFESFVQAGNDMVRRFGGTGLGLSITKRLIDLQGGQIHVCSEQGVGSSFQFILTYQKSQLKNAASTVTANFKAVEGSLKGKRILLVEDNPVNQKVTFHLLKKAGLVVDIANDGKEAVEKLEAGKQYDLVIMDLQMQEMDGFQTTIYIRQKLKLDLPIIAMTASALRNERSKCFEVGMNEYLTKPFVPAELFMHLRRFLTSESEAVTVVEKRQEPAPEQKLYDLSFVKEMDDPEYTIEILQLFLETTPVSLDEIKEATLHEKWEAVYQGAHKLKSSVGVLQMNGMLAQVTRIEQMAKEQTDLDKIPAILKDLVRELNLIRPMLEAELAEARRQLC